MKITGVDPRTGGWEGGQPRYRVYFWMEGPSSLSSDEYEIEDAADVHEVIEWANGESERRETERPEVAHTHTLYVVSQRLDPPPTNEDSSS